MEAFEFYGFDSTKPTVLIIGGSLGAKSINEAINKYINDVSLILPKKITQSEGICKVLRKLTRNVRQILFPDIIKI